MITATFLGGNIAVNPQNGTVTMGASVALVDDQLGQVGQRGVSVDDPQIVAMVTGFIQQMLPSLSASLGVPVTLPVAPDPVAPVEPPGEGDGGGGGQ